MEKKTWIILAAIVAVFGALIGVSIWQHRNDPNPLDEFNQIYAASDANGNFEEHIVGKADAPVKIYEYADYECSGCALLSPALDKLVDEYDGKVAVIFRAYQLNGHNNSRAVTYAANAAALQGYWKEYKDILFAKQNEWYDSDAATLQKQLEDYFKEATANKGDLARFKTDMKSDQVAKKTNFDYDLGEKIDLQWTPYIIVENELIPRSEMSTNVGTFLGSMRARINARL